MKRLLVPSIAASLLAIAAPTFAQVHGALSEARVVPVNARLGAAYLQFDKSSATLMGQLRLSFYPNLDFGFLGGLSRIDLGDNTRTSVRLAGDFRGQMATQGSAFPVNIVLGGTIGVESADDFTILSVGPLAVASRQLDNAGRWMGGGWRTAARAPGTCPESLRWSSRDSPAARSSGVVRWCHSSRITNAVALLVSLIAVTAL